MNKLLVILALVFGPVALAEPCKEHRDIVIANFKLQDWKLVSYTADDVMLSVSFRKEVKEGTILANFLYTSNTLLAQEAHGRCFETLTGVCTIGRADSVILVRTTKQVRT